MYAISSVIIWVPKIDQLLTQDYAAITNCITLDDGWNITINDDTFQDILLDDFRFPAVRKGDQIVMWRVLPEDWNIVEGALRLPIKHSAVKVYIDEELIYEYGSDRIAAHKTVGSGFQFINFPDEYHGKILKINLDVAEDKMFTKLDSIRIYPWENAYRVLMTENRYPLFFGGFLFVFGLLGCIMTAFALVFSRKYIRILCISFFSLCMGLWTMCYYRVLLVYAIPLHAISLMEYIAIYLTPIPLIGYMHDNVRNLKRKPISVIYWILLAGYCAAFAVMMTLHMFDIVHLAAMLSHMIAFMIADMIFFFIVILMNFKESRTVNRLYLIGLLIIVFCAGYDLIGYGSERYYGNDSLSAIKGVSSIGVMIFIFILFLSFYIEMTQKMMQEKERDFLIKSAYTDELTKLHNRRYYIEYMNKIREEKSCDYTVLCFDLNNLKTVNDTYGHTQGDILIRSAAEVLAETFAEQGMVARVGGDEFVSIINSADEEKVAGLMAQFQENIRRKNRQVENLNMSIACGYATGRENKEDIEKVYQVADDRMYEDKKRIKEGLTPSYPPPQ